MRQVPSWYVATLGSTGFQTRATVVEEGGTLLLASSKPWVASLGPLTVLKSPRDLAPPCQRQPPRQDGGPWDVASLVTDSPCPARGYSEFDSGRSVPWPGGLWCRLGLLIAGVLWVDVADTSTACLAASGSCVMKHAGHNMMREHGCAECGKCAVCY